MQVIVLEDMFAHHLWPCTSELVKPAGIFMMFGLKERYPINKSIVEKRAGEPFDELVNKMHWSIRKNEQPAYSRWPWGALTPRQKDWARAKAKRNHFSIKSTAIKKRSLKQFVVFDDPLSNQSITKQLRRLCTIFSVEVVR